MEIKDLKKAWNQISNTSGQEQLTDEKIRQLLSSRTANLMERIDKNIRIGFALLFLIIVAMIIFDFYMVSNQEIGAAGLPGIPRWVTLLDRGTNLFIFILFIVFVIRYRYTRKKCDAACNLRQGLIQVIQVLTTYNRLFVLALVMFLLASASGYVAGYYTGITAGTPSEFFQPFSIIFGIITLILLTGFLFLLIRWIFRKIFGQYLAQLRETLRELDELK
jgi:hypothetical protein